MLATIRADQPPEVWDEFPYDTLFLAMTWHRFGDADQADERLRWLQRVTQPPNWARRLSRLLQRPGRADVRQLMREVERVLASEASPNDDE